MSLAVSRATRRYLQCYRLFRHESNKWIYGREWCKTKVTVSRKPGDGQLDLEKIRNIGIMAHIDAGKTTTTERFLYYSGVINEPGEVHHGDTVTDFMPQERERGITIQSAVVSYPWSGCTVNLIDTPGHVDFTFEVQRSLRVVDSAVAILDASAGVQAQTLTVWRQAAEYNLPRLVFLNKMDKASSSKQLCLESITSKLKTIPILLQEPIYSSEHATSTASGLVGVLDIVEMKRIIYDQKSKGLKFVEVDGSSESELQKLRCKLVEQVADLDIDLANLVIEKESLESISNADLNAAIRRITLSNQAVPVYLGSSYKNIGVQPLMDGILRFLPHPMEQVHNVEDSKLISCFGNELCTFAFKTIHDSQLGPLTFLRVFRGVLITGQKLYNVTRGKTEKITKVYRSLADELKETNEVTNGQVCIVTGLKDTITGDTLTSSHPVSNSVQRKAAKVFNRPDIKAVLPGVNVPEPVFFCSIEPHSLSYQKSLDEALKCLLREDPSLHVHIDNDTGQTVLSGMGELHLEIIYERIKSEYKIEADLGRLQIAYKETLASPVTKRINFQRQLADRKHSVIVELELVPTFSPSEQSNLPTLSRSKKKDLQEHLATVSERSFRLAEEGLESAGRCGPKLGFQVLDVKAYLNHLEVTRGTTETIIIASVANCFREALQDVGMYLLEPIVWLEITVDSKYLQLVTNDLNRRRFQLKFIDDKHGNKVITGYAPISELMGYSTALRVLSSGFGTYHMQFSHNQIVNNPIEENKIIERVRGF